MILGQQKKYLYTPSSKTLYVDNQRTDNYVENGTITRPFKTIMGAVNKIISNADNTWVNQYCIKIAIGTYAENIVLENTALYAITFEGDGYRQTKIEPSSGYAVQSTANNDNLAWLIFKNIWFAKDTDFTGASTNQWFGYNLFFNNCYWNSGGALFKNLSYPSFCECTKFSNSTVKFSNCTQATLSAGCEIGSAVSTFTLETDQTGGVKTPKDWTNGTKILFVGAQSSKDLTWTLTNITTWTGSALQVRQARFGSSGQTIPANATLLAYGSVLLGSYVNNGTLSLYNSSYTGSISGGGTLNVYSSKYKNFEVNGDFFHSGTKIGFYNTAAVVKTAVTDQSSWVNILSGSDSVDLADLNTKVQAIRDKLQSLIDSLQSYGII